MQVFMFRHAERENSGTTNPPLSRRGLLQTEKIAQLVETGAISTPTKCFSSPLLRAQQTFSKLKLEITIVDDLTERRNSESAEQFRKRIQKFLNSLDQQSGVVFFVTHLDWIEEALILMNTELTLDHWPPGQMAQFDLQDGVWHFEKLKGCEP